MNPVKTAAARGMCLFQVLSLDVVGGALAGGVFAVKFLQVKPNPWWWPVLALSVWAVYTADHLVDGFSQKNNAAIFRHRFHYRYRHFFIVALGVAAFVAVALVWIFMDRHILLWGMLLGVGALVYLLLIAGVHKSGFYFHKEFFISLFYVAGIWLAPVFWYGIRLSTVQMATLVIFVLLAWAEGLAMALFEQKADQADQMGSFSTYYGTSFTKVFSGTLLSVALTAALFLLWYFPALQTAYLVLSAMAVALLAVLLFSHYFQKGQRYRLMGEFSFWLPFLLLF